MKPAAAVCLALICVSLVGAAAAAEPSRLAALFPQEADVFAAGDGLVRLDLPAEVMSSCRPDLSDLRIFDLEQHEVAFAIDTGGPIERWQSHEAEVQGVQRSEIRRERAPSLWREVYRIVSPKQEPEGGSWQLEVVTAKPSFVYQLRIEQVLDNGERVELLASRSLFRRVDGSRTRFDVGRPTGDIEVTIEGEEGDYLDPRFVFRSARQLDRMLESRLAMTVRETSHSAGRTILSVTRDPGLVPQRLRLESSTVWFDRAVVVWDERRGHAERRLGAGRLRRVQGNPDDDQLEITIDRPSGEGLRIEISDGDSPALGAIAVQAVVRRPSLLFAVERTQADGLVGTLRFGGGRAHLPRYDVASLVAQASAGLSGDTQGAVRLRDRQELAAATLGPMRANRLYDPEPILGFAMRPGTEIEPRVYAASRRLRVQPSVDGAARLVLAVEDLAHSLADLADVRVVDAQNRQWPYVIDFSVPPQPLELQVEPAATRAQVSTYVLRPALALRLDSLTLATDTAMVDRPFELLAHTRTGKTVPLMRDRMRRGPDEVAPLQLKFAATEVESFELRVEDGDNAPLVWSSAQALVRLPALVLVAPAGEYRMLVGYGEAKRPRYEVEGLSDLILSVDSGTVAAEALVPNPDFRRLARFATGEGARTTMQQLAFWGALVLATLVLGGITLRLVRSSGPPTAP